MCHLKSKLLGAGVENTSATHTWERRVPIAAGLLFQLEIEMYLRNCAPLSVLSFDIQCVRTVDVCSSVKPECRPLLSLLICEQAQNQVFYCQ